MSNPNTTNNVWHRNKIFYRLQLRSEGKSKSDKYLKGELTWENFKMSKRLERFPITWQNVLTYTWTRAKQRRRCTTHAYKGSNVAKIHFSETVAQWSILASYQRLHSLSYLIIKCKFQLTCRTVQLPIDTFSRLSPLPKNTKSITIQWTVMVSDSDTRADLKHFKDQKTCYLVFVGWISWWTSSKNLK